MKITEKYPYKEWNDLEINYPNTWVLLFNPTSKDTGLKAESGYLVYQDKEKSKVVQKSLDISLWENIKGIKSIGIFYTGVLKLPKDHVICLGL